MPHFTRYFRYCLFAIGLSGLSACSKDAKSDAAAAPDGAGGSLARYTLAGNYLYLVDDSKLDVYDCSDLAHPVFRSSHYIGFGIETIYPYKDKLYIGAATGMYVYGLDDPANPKLEGSVTHVRACDPVVANDTVAYVTLRSFGTNCGGTQNVLNVYDIRHTNPKLVKTVVMAAPAGLGIYRNALYVCEGDKGMSVFDISEGFDPVLVKTIKGKIYQDVIPYNGVLISHIDEGICFFDISSPLQPVETGTVKNL